MGRVLEITAPDGKTYEITAPQDMSDESAVSRFKSEWQANSKPSAPKVDTFDDLALDKRERFQKEVDAYQPSYTERMKRSVFMGAQDEIVAGMRSAFVAAPKNILRGQSPNIGQEYNDELRLQRAIRDKEKAGTDGALGVVSDIAGGLVLGAPKAAVSGAAPVAQGLWQTGKHLVKTGAVWGGGQSFMEADGSKTPDGTIVEDFAERSSHVPMGMAAGAAGALAFGAGIAGASKIAGQYRGWRNNRLQAKTDAVAANADEARSVGITEPFAPAMADSGIHARLAQGVGAGVGGKAVGDKAGRNIAELETGMNRLLSGPVGGQEAGDLGKSVQGDLRRALVERSRPEGVKSLADEDIHAITGPVSEGGFLAPRPKVEPVRPREVEPFPPRDVGPEPQPPAATDHAARLQQQIAQREAEIQGSVSEFNKTAESFNAARASRDAELESSGIFRVVPNNGRYSVEFPSQSAKGADGKIYRSARRTMDFDPKAPYHQGGALSPDQFLAVQRQVQGLADEAAFLAAHQGRVQKLRDLHADRDRLSNELTQTQGREASERATYDQSRQSWGKAQSEAQADAATRHAEAVAAAQREAQDATRQATSRAEQQYQSEIASGNNAFRPGRSNESYPTEIEAAYEAVSRVAPKGKLNPFGDGYAPTNTTKLLDDVGSEAKRKLKLEGYSGRVLDADGANLDQALTGYIRSHLGDDLTRRLVEMSEHTSPKKHVHPDAVRSLISDLGAAARKAEHPQFPAEPRPEAAALMRRLQGAIKRDAYEQLGRQGRSPSFQTRSGDYTVNQGGSTQSHGRAPSDATYYMEPRNAERLNSGPYETDKMTSTLPRMAVQTEKQPGRELLVGRFDPVKGEFDRSSMVPARSTPEPGLVPVQIWDKGQRMHYGSEIVSRGPTEGERAVAMFKNVDQSRAQYGEELRRPLSKIFGPNVEPVQAMDRLGTAVMKGETSIISAYGRVMSEKAGLNKADPNKGAAAVLYHLSGGGRDMKKFNETWRAMPDVSKKALFIGDEGQRLRGEIERFVRVGERLEKFVSAAKVRPFADTGRITHIATVAAIANPATMLHAVAMVGGNAVAARVLSSPRYLRWLSEMPDKARGGFDTAAFSQHLARLGRMAVSGEDRRTSRAISQSVMKLSEQDPIGDPSIAPLLKGFSSIKMNYDGARESTNVEDRRGQPPVPAEDGELGATQSFTPRNAEEAMAYREDLDDAKRKLPKGQRSPELSRWIVGMEAGLSEWDRSAMTKRRRESFNRDMKDVPAMLNVPGTFVVQ